MTGVQTCALPISIPDNNPLGASDTIAFPDVGLAQVLTVAVNIQNSDVSTLKVSLFDPANNEYLLCSGSTCGKKGDAINTTYPTLTKTQSGDLTTWTGKNPKGNWYIKVVDAAFLNNQNDGAIVSWSVATQTLSNQQVGINGNLIVEKDANLKGNATVGGNLTVNGTLNLGGTTGSLLFPNGSRPFLYGQIEDHTEGNWVYHAATTWASGCGTKIGRAHV